MGIRTILVHLDSRRHTPARVESAAALALQHEAHLIGMASTGWVPIPADSAGALGITAYQEAAMNQLRDEAQACVQRFEEQVRRLGVLSFEGRVDLSYAGDSMPLAARYCDLTVVTQTDPDEPREAPWPPMQQEVLLQSGRPLLVLPYAGECIVPPAARVLVGWNGSREAARAMHDALPLLERAAHVEVVVFEPPESVEQNHGDLPGADIGLWLTRHGVNVHVSYVPIKVATGEALLSHAADIGAHLIVAGGYGHSRLREAILGGVTRTLMRTSPVPVLLSH
ncbi:MULTISPECIES: universal stress protein [Roseateles]|uniref:Universal stress protein n=1 Tax=Pelomonas caseinilytica TaxID=2906763 RepID=A0ABS8XLP9_9BURK|nr:MULTISPECIES: universal stress protein [unclassified Roseateles]MCE4539761.1 universal stress protein [Pelomonas sp. P7]HEV6963820.1 universal stress protein [Roseateles sp.]